MTDPLDMEIADEIDKISKDIKSILDKIETVYPKKPKTETGDGENVPEGKPVN